MRYVILIVCLLFSNVSAGDEPKGKQLSIFGIMKMDVSNIEDVVRKTAYAAYTKHGIHGEKWEKAYAKELDRVITRYHGERVAVDFDGIGKGLNTTILEKYNEQVKKAFPPRKKKLLEDKIRNYLLRNYMRTLAKTYVRMKNNNKNVESCSKVIGEDKLDLSTAIICLDVITEHSLQYSVFQPNDKKMIKLFGMYYSKSSNEYTLRKIILNEQLIDDNFFYYLAYIK